MHFGSIALDEAEGAILAHGVRTGAGLFKKGRVLSRDDLDVLAAEGHSSVIGARLETGDVDEDTAARRVAAACIGENVTMAAPFTGRANIFADDHGLAIIDAQRVDALNGLSETVTIATVPSLDPVSPRQMLATIKIIPFAAGEADVAAAERIAGEPVPLVSLAPFKTCRVGLVVTRLPQTQDKIVEKSRRAIKERVEALGSVLAEVMECPHDAESVAASVERLAGLGCDPVLVFGASAIVDRADVIPAGLKAAGGRVLHLGMPVDPGNLLMLGDLGARHVIGVPSCARSPKVNGFDWVLQRLLAGVPVTGADLARMGAGGLLKEIPSRPTPREGRSDATVPRAPSVAAIVLAAGQSRRMGAVNKLLEPVGGRAMIRKVVTNVMDADVAETVVVIGHEADRVRSALDGLDVRFVVNENFAGGLSTSLKTGLDAVGDGADGAIVCLGDMPLVSPAHVNRLIAAFNPVEGRGVCVPVVNGKRGNPVLWARAYFTEIAGVQGDVGARHLLGQFADDVCEVAMDDRAVMTDIDTPDALRSLKASGDV